MKNWMRPRSEGEGAGPRLLTVTARHLVMPAPPPENPAPVRRVGDWLDDRIIELACNAVRSPRSREEYRAWLRRFLEWFRWQPNRKLDRPTVQAWVTWMLEERGLKPASANLGLSAVKKMVREAMDANLLSHADGAPILTIAGARIQGHSTGRWLTRDEAQALLLKPDLSTLRGMRDQAALSLMIGAALRRGEVCTIAVEQIEQRRGRWVLANVIRKGNRVQTVPIPDWVYASVRRWLDAAGIHTGPVIRAMDRGGHVQDRPILPLQMGRVVTAYSTAAGAPVRPHDLRRTATDLMFQSEASMREIQTALGHASIATTERYMAPMRELENPACDKVRFQID